MFINIRPKGLLFFLLLKFLGVRGHYRRPPPFAHLTPIRYNPARRQWREAIVRLQEKTAWLRARLNYVNVQPSPLVRRLSPAPFHVPRGRYCDQHYNLGRRVSGAYAVNIMGTLTQVYCQFQHEGHNWIVFQRRIDGMVDFFLNWQTYKLGFGRLENEFWLGLDNLNRLTASGTCILRVDLEDFNDRTVYAEYSFFQVGDEKSLYQLSLGFYRGDAGDSLTRHDKMKFSTMERDNDNWEGGNCAMFHHGAWWYNSCQYSNLNGQYYDVKLYSTQGVNWFHWQYNELSMKRASMKLRNC